MRVKQWLKARRVTAEQLARDADVSRPTIYLAMHGRIANVQVAKLIVRATGGQVTLEDVTHAVQAKSKRNRVAAA